jgi:hypothetical protein
MIEWLQKIPGLDSMSILGRLEICAAAGRGGQRLVTCDTAPEVFGSMELVLPACDLNPKPLDEVNDPKHIAHRQDGARWASVRFLSLSLSTPL